MHEDQVDVSVDTVAGLVASQFPQWRDLPVRRFASRGTVNALFRLGDEIVLRLPLQPSLDPELRAELVQEQAYARDIAADVPLPVPEPIGLGEPDASYPGPWTAYRWIPGEPATNLTMGDPDVFARDLAGFVGALRRRDTGGRRWDGMTRGGPLSASDENVRRSLVAGAHLMDSARLGEIWTECLAADHEAPDVWIHADLMPGNLLVREGRLAAVIDLETVCVGDPAVDLMPAWNLLAPGARQVYRRELGVDDATWQRGRGWAIIQAAVALPYYVDTNPVMAETARHTLEAVTGVSPA